MIPTTTALLAEYLVVGALAWLWILPIIMSIYRFSALQILDYLGAAPAPHLLIVIFATYVIGVFTESLSFAIEKWAVGATSSPRRWYTDRIAKMEPSDWHAAQDRMWSSETAFKEFKQTSLRSTVSRGAFCNSILIMLVLVGCWLLGRWQPGFGLILCIGGALGVISPMSWWFAQAEHTARVRVAGAIETEKHSEHSDSDPT